MLIQTLFYLREYFFPSGCGGCGEALFSREDAYFGLCGECRAFLEAALNGESRCETCGKPLISEKQTCLYCRAKEARGSRIIRTRVLFPYTGKFRAILGSYKFGKSLGVGNFLARRLQLALENFNPGAAEDAAAKNAVWVPVPPRHGKIKKQGWDQVEYLARLLSSKGASLLSSKGARLLSSKGTVYRCLKRLPSRSQKELNREQRYSNLKGRIVLTRQAPKTAVLFDDVFTTGATLDACAQALFEGGTEKVYGVCLFYD